MKQNFNYFITILFSLLTTFHWLSQIVAQEEWRVPDMPENVHWKTDDNSITLWWDPPLTADEILVRGYTISYGIGAPNQRVIIEGANTNSFTINKLKSNTTYVFALTAYNEADGEDSEKVLFTATTEVGKNSDEQLIDLQAPTNIQAKSISPTEIAIQWTDPNVHIYYNHPSEIIKSLFRKRKYVIQYGEYQSLNLEKVTSTVSYVLLNNLQPATDYVIIIKVILPNGIESAWTIREVIRTPSNVTLMNGSELFELRFGFEQSEKCFFYSDPTAPLQWKMIEGKSNRALKNRLAKHFVSLQSTIFDENYGQLISSPIILNDNNYCLSIWIYVRQFSKGIITVGLLRKAENYNAGNSLLIGKLEEVPKEQWNHLLMDFINSYDLFKVSIRIEKEDGDHFWLALDDIALYSGMCNSDSDAFLQGNEEFKS
ncbi:Fibronectin type III domain family protein [Acanthocheilonema viteae]